MDSSQSEIRLRSGILHGLADRIVLHKLIFRKERIEHRTRDDVLRQHFNGLAFVDTRIQIFLQTFQIGIELCLMIGFLMCFYPGIGLISILNKQILPLK